jgi:methanogenic corrinoid protein MtbC1
MNNDQVRSELLKLIRLADRRGANRLLEAWSTAHGHERLIVDVLEPTLTQLGEAWQHKEAFTIAQAYVAARIVEEAVSQSVARSPETPVASKGQVVLGNIQDDFHSLGCRLVTTFLQKDGWRVHNLGNDVPPAVFLDKALEVGAKVIGVSAMIYSTAQNIVGLRQEIDRRGLKGRLQMAVGGAIFLARPSLVAEVGGDGTAPNALAAGQLFTQLWQRAEQWERDHPPSLVPANSLASIPDKPDAGSFV